MSLGIISRWSLKQNLEQEVKCVNDIIDNLLLHYGYIERLSIDVTILSSLLSGELPIEHWIHQAAKKGVKHILLKLYSVLLDIPPSLFACHLLRDLELKTFMFTGIPTEFDGFRSIQSCSLSRLSDLTDDGLQQLIGLCPLLHKLVLVDCLDLISLKIEAPNLNSLNIAKCSYMKSLTADCPQLVELELENCKELIEFRMNSCVLFHDRLTSDIQIPKELPMLNSLRKLSVKTCPIVSDLKLLTTLGYFRNLEEVHIQRKNSTEQMCEEDNSEQERAKGEVVADSNFPNLKKVYVDISSPSVMKKEEAVMLEFLLNNAPSLNTIIVTLPHCPKCPLDIHKQEFTNKVQGLRQIYEKVDIRIDYHFGTVDETDYDRSDDPWSDDALYPPDSFYDFSPLYRTWEDDNDYEWHRSRRY